MRPTCLSFFLLFLILSISLPVNAEDKSYKNAYESSKLIASNTNLPTSTYFTSTPKSLISNEWQFFIAPYLWFVSLSGDQAVNGNEVELDASFGDLWDNLDFAFQIHAEAMKDNYFFFLDETYMKLSIGKDIEPKFAFSNGSEIDLEVKMNALEFGGGYRFDASSENIPLFLDLLTGIRWWIVDNDLEIELNNIVDLDVDDNEQWVDIFIGARLIAYLTDNILATVKTDIGGFDFGFSSTFSWNIIANLGWDTGWNGFTPYVGWRSMYVDYEDGSGNDFFKYNVWMNGIQAGFGFRF